MAGLKPAQAKSLLNTWDEAIQKKIPNLTNGARFYKVVGIFGKVLTIMLVGASAAMTTHFLKEDDDEDKQRRLTIAIIICSILAEVLLGADTLIKPVSKGSECSITAKLYADLSREINVVMAMLHNYQDDDYIPEELYQQIMYYSAREQQIIQNEPLLICIGRRRGKQVIKHNNKFGNPKIKAEIMNSNLSDKTKDIVKYVMDFSNDDISETELENIV